MKLKVIFVSIILALILVAVAGLGQSRRRLPEGTKVYRDLPYVIGGHKRLSQHSQFPAQIEDCKAAVRWLRANADKYNIDANSFGVWGESAGGHLVAMLGTTGDVNDFDRGERPGVSSRVQAVVDYFGPTDFLQMDEHRLAGGMTHNTADSPEGRGTRWIQGPERAKIDEGIF